jgi:hypothetical protein
MTDNKLSDAYQEAVRAHEAAKAGIGNRVETFTRFLVAEKVFATRMALADQSLARLRTRYSA